MTQTHTPTPWITHANDQIAAMVGDDLLNIAWALSASMGKDLPSVANAERIVLCCNAHDDLVAALKYCRNSFQRYDDEAGYDYHSNEIDKINAALAKAGEK